MGDRLARSRNRGEGVAGFMVELGAGLTSSSP